MPVLVLCDPPWAVSASSSRREPGWVPHQQESRAHAVFRALAEHRIRSGTNAFDPKRQHSNTIVLANNLPVLLKALFTKAYFLNKYFHVEYLIQ